MEQWITIENFTRYEISTDGRIRNSNTGRILKPQPNNQGYAVVSLYKDRKPHTKKVHKLVAESFYDNILDLDVNHLDGNKLNNKLSNLELCSRSENLKHAFHHGLKQPSNQIRIMVIETGRIYDSIRECGRDTNCNQSDICKCLSGKLEHCKGYHFKKI